MTEEGIARIDSIKQAAKEAIKGTPPLEGSKIYLAGTAAVYKDMSDGNNYDLMIAAILALALIFTIMLILTRSVVAAATIVGTVVISLGASFGLSILIWQHILGIELHWMVMAMAIIILLAVGADYNLLLVSRLKEELHAGGVNTGIIRAMGGSGSVVTSAGLVFAFTMMSMAVSELTVIGQVGTTIGLGLLFDTLVIRAFMTPSIAALMGKWFWWPQRVRSRPVPAPWPKPKELTTSGSEGGPVMKRLIAAIATATAALVLAAPAHADPDTDFANELHTYGIYGQKDYNAWIGKITCKRQRNGVDKSAHDSARFVQAQLDKEQDSTEQSYQFLAAALRFYCPDLLPILDQAR